jgi:hypothetical protein
VTRERIRSWVAALVILVVLLVAALVTSGRDAHSIRRRREAPTTPSVAPEFAISGSVRGMFPGRIASIPVRVRNPMPFPIIVTKVSARVRSAGRGCGEGNLRVQPIRGTWLIDPGGSIRLRANVRMPMTAPDACQGLEFPLHFGGKAVRG